MAALNSTVKATETVCQAFYHILRSIKTRFTQGRLFYTQGPFFCARGPLFCALVREEAIFAVCKRCANEGFACMCKVLDLGLSASGAGSCCFFTLAVRQPPVLASCIEIYYYYAVWQLLLYFYREFPVKIVSVYVVLSSARFDFLELRNGILRRLRKFRLGREEWKMRRKKRREK